MATRAFLLCGDEKAVQAVTQILDELEVSFEHSSEPAFSLKRLATQRFELLIIDCDNVQNATQVFNSARASNLNKTSIAIAIVEGKAGVPNAFRLGASLVLTKPVALEQVRNTLRTGIGMSRKDVPEAKAPVVAAPVPASPVSTTPSLPVAVVPPPAPRPVAPPVLTPVASTTPAPSAKIEAPKPSVPATPAAEKPAAPAAPATPSADSKPAPASAPEVKAIVTKPAPKAAATAATAAAPAKNFDSIFTTPPPDKPVAAKEASPKSGTESKPTSDAKPSTAPALSIVDPLAEEEEFDPLKDHGVPSFGAMGKQSFAGLPPAERKSRKGVLIAAIVVLLIAIGAYAAWLTQPAFRKLVAYEYLNLMSKISGAHGEDQPAAAEMSPSPTPAPTPAPTATTTPASSDTNSPNGNPATNSAPGASTTQPEGTNPNSVPDSSAAQPPAGISNENAPKTASIQTAKQDKTANHNGANPSLVPASLPPNSASKSSSSDLVEVPEDFADDQIVHRVHPTYPKQARARKLHGTVVLQAVVNKQGRVDSLQLVSGDALLAQAAADAVKQWRYKPYSHNGEPADFQTRVTVEFKQP